MATAQQKAAAGVVVGMKALTGEVKSRLEIDDLITMGQGDCFNLFLLALSALQKDTSSTGYYGLAGSYARFISFFLLTLWLGIHGLPTDTWDGVNRVIIDRFGGYCAHGVYTFPTWHRPFLALFEVKLHYLYRQY